MVHQVPLGEEQDHSPDNCQCDPYVVQDDYHNMVCMHQSFLIRQAEAIRTYYSIKLWEEWKASPNPVTACRFPFDHGGTVHIPLAADRPNDLP